MKKPRLKHVSEYSDRHGKLRTRFRRSGFGTYLFVNKPGSEGFWEEYQLCKISNKAADVRAAYQGKNTSPVKVDRDPTMQDLANVYYCKDDFKSLAPATKVDYRSVIEAFLKDYGAAKVRAFTPPAIQAIIESWAKTPTRANKLKKRLRTLFNLSIFLGWRDTDPMIGVKKLRYKSGGYHTWTDSEIAQYEATHGPGTKARLALYLYLFTGVRRSDVVTLGRQHMKNGKIKVRAQKNKNWVHIPIHQNLMVEIDRLPNNQMQFILSEYNRPYSAKGFGARMRKWCDQAKLPQCSSHGLRKAISRRLAEAGATTLQIGAVIGDTDLKAIEVYVAEANKETLAASGVAKLPDVFG